MCVRVFYIAGITLLYLSGVCKLYRHQKMVMILIQQCSKSLHLEIALAHRIIKFYDRILLCCVATMTYEEVVGRMYKKFAANTKNAAEREADVITRSDAPKNIILKNGAIWGMHKEKNLSKEGNLDGQVSWLSVMV